MARKLLIALFGAAICVAAVLVMNPPAASSSGDKKPPARKTSGQEGTGTPKKDSDCVGCTIPSS